MIAPNPAPIAEPYPPCNKQPPTTEAMIASNSFNKPLAVSAEPASITCIVAYAVAAQAVPINRRVLTNVTGTPAFLAPLASPPAANIQFPNFVLNEQIV